MAFTIQSSAFDNGGTIPKRFTCDGKNTNPPLSISGVPESAESLVLIMEDPDVPEDMEVDMWDHWIVFNMPAADTDIEEGVEPNGVHGTGTADNEDYYGPCPPDGMHRYFFYVYALDTMLDTGEGASKNQVQDAMDGHVIAQAQLMGQYDRQ